MPTLFDCEYQIFRILIVNIAFFSEKTDAPHLPNQSWKWGQGHQNLITFSPVQLIYLC